jgi:hypothetical protein
MEGRKEWGGVAEGERKVRGEEGKREGRRGRAGVEERK